MTLSCYVLNKSNVIAYSCHHNHRKRSQVLPVFMIERKLSGLKLILKTMENSKSLRLFSQETLDSAVMSEIYGGDTPNNCTCPVVIININGMVKCETGCKNNEPQT